MRWYTTTRLSEHQELTPEGFLLVKGVPVARCGVQHYHNSEIEDLVPDAAGWISVDREPAEVFREDSIASFTGKPIVDDHPFGIVDPDNYSELAIGHMQHPRRGEGADNDVLLADLLFTTRRGIQLVQNGKRAVSVGYDAFYEQTAPGLARQRNIIANHVALVDEGRCGQRCTILDGAPSYTYDADLIHPSDHVATHDGACGCETCRSRGKETTMSKRTIADWIRHAFLTKDEAAVAKLIADAEKEHAEPDGDEGKHATTGTEGGVHVHIEHKDDGTADQATETRLKNCEDGIKALDTKVSQVLDAVSKMADQNPFAKKDDDDDKTNDQDPGEGAATAETLASAEPDLMEADPALKTGRSQMGDAKYSAAVGVALGKLITDTRARCELLAPGMQLITVDAKPGAAAQNGLCDMRRAALTHAAGSDVGKAVMSPRHTADAIKAMSCEAVRVLFLDASDRMAVLNNGAARNTGSFAADDQRGYRATQTERLTAINKANRQFWANQAGQPLAGGRTLN